jgi:hypothetical protein
MNGNDIAYCFLRLNICDVLRLPQSFSISHHQLKSDLRLLQFQFPFSHGDTYIAAFNAGPSLTPSPTMATTCLSFFKALTTASFASETYG